MRRPFEVDLFKSIRIQYLYLNYIAFYYKLHFTIKTFTLGKFNIY